ncbi:hypothetical protein [Microbacterium testaceum]|nr:hypothetical protein [Microbacterium testaceum]
MRHTPGAVATTGIPLHGWTPLPDETVSIVTPSSVASVSLERF